MAFDISRSAKEFFSSDAGAKLAGKESEINRLADSSDGQKVKNMLDNCGINVAEAFEKGNTAALKSALEQILRTEEGGRVMNELSKMIK